MAEQARNVRAVVDIHHYPDGTPVVATWPTIVPKGSVVAALDFQPTDLTFLFQNGHVVETDDPVAPVQFVVDEATAEQPAPAAPPVTEPEAPAAEAETE